MQLSSMLDEIARLKELIQRHSDSGTVLPSEEARCPLCRILEKAI